MNMLNTWHSIQLDFSCWIKSGFGIRFLAGLCPNGLATLMGCCWRCTPADKWNYQNINLKNQCFKILGI